MLSSPNAYFTVMRIIASSVFFCVAGSVAAQNPNPNANLTERAYQLFDKRLAKEIEARIAAEEANNATSTESIVTGYLGDRLYNRLGTGKFEGAPTITWNGLDSESRAPTFIYKGSGFAYITAMGRRIEPRKMDTDGGSIPQILQAWKKASAWHYGPAFIIHDWIFVAHKCGIKPDSKIGFKESADIMAEIMKTLTEVGFRNVKGEVQKLAKAEDTMYAMHRAVTSSIAKRLWDNVGNVTCYQK